MSVKTAPAPNQDNVSWMEKSCVSFMDTWMDYVGKILNEFITTEFYSCISGMSLQQILHLKNYTGVDLPKLASQAANPTLQMQLECLRTWVSQAQLTWAVMDPFDIFKTRSKLQDFRRRLDIFERAVTTKAKIATSPRKLVWKMGKTHLYRYTPVVPESQRKPVPLLLVFAIMNRPSILDLMPGRSYVEYMVKNGYDVYLLDWGEPGTEEKNHDFSNYALDYLPSAVAKVKEISGSPEISMLGWCLGALISTLYATARPNDGLRNLVLLTAPLDFGDPNLTFKKWLNPLYFDVDDLLDAYDGFMPASFISSGAAALKPIDNSIGSYAALWRKIDDEKFVEFWTAMNTWKEDNIPLAGHAYHDLVVNFYRENQLTRGCFKMKGETVHLEHAKANLLVVVAEADHITPPPQTVNAFPLFTGAGDRELFRIKGGHIGIMTGSNSRKITWPHIDQWLAARSH